MSKNENISKNKNMTHEERIKAMKENMGIKFKDEGKKIIADCKVIKGKNAKENFNTEVNSLTFELEELYPLNYNEFKKEFPNVIKVINEIGGSIISDGINKGNLVQGLSVRTNVDKTIENIKENIKDEEKAKEMIEVRNKAFEETQKMEEKFDFEWNQDLAWKCWHIKEGEKRWNYLKNQKGQKLAKKRIKTIKDIGGIEFCKKLQNEIYGN